MAVKPVYKTKPLKNEDLDLEIQNSVSCADTTMHYVDSHVIVAKQ